jgi:hypothetical protein
MKSVLSPIKNPQSPSKSVNLIELDSPHVSKPPRFSTPTNMQLSFGSETTPTETKLAGMIGIPTESPTKLSKQLEKTELMLTEAEGLCARLENENKELVNEKMGLKKEFKDLKSKNERLEGMVQDYESQLSQLRVSSTDTVTSRIKGIYD